MTLGQILVLARSYDFALLDSESDQIFGVSVVEDRMMFFRIAAIQNTIVHGQCNQTIRQITSNAWEPCLSFYLNGIPATRSDAERTAIKEALEKVQSVSSDLFSDRFDDMQKAVHQVAVEHGWWDGDRNDGELLALIHSEVSEMLEDLRKDPNMKSEKIPGFLAVEDEAADVIIRLMDMAEARGWRIGKAVVAKNEFNRGRPHKHGKKF